MSRRAGAPAWPLAVVAATAVALALRLAWVLWVTVTPSEPNSDTAQILAVAEQFAGFETMSLNGHVTAWVPPGYPLLLVPVVWLSDTTGWFDLPLGAALVNVVAGTATVALGAVLAGRWFGRTEAAVAAWIIALAPGHVFLTSAALSETVYTALLLGALLLVTALLQAPAAPSTRLLVGLGALGGAIALIRTPGGVVLLLAALALRSRLGSWRSAVRPLAVMGLAAAALLAPWGLRNGLQVGVWTPVATSNAAFLCQGHRDDAEIDTTELEDEDFRPCFEGTPFAPEPDEAAWYGRTVREAAGWAVSHPAEEARLTWDKTFLLLRDNSQAISDGQDFGAQETVPFDLENILRGLTNAWHRGVLLVGVAGAALLRSGRRAWPLWALGGALVAAVWGGVPVDRFHHTTMALLAVLGAATLVAVGRWASAGVRDRAEAGAAADEAESSPPPPADGLDRAARPRSALAGPYGHPFHPLVAAVAIGAWVFSFGFDLVSQVADTEWVYARGAWFLTGGGVAVGLVAALLGLVDLLGIPRGTRAFRTGVRHLVAMDVSLVLFTTSFLIRNASDFRFHDAVDPLPMALSAIGLVTVSIGGWLGGRLAYSYGVRVAVDDDRKQGFEPADR